MAEVGARGRWFLPSVSLVVLLVVAAIAATGGPTILAMHPAYAIALGVVGALALAGVATALRR
ncbi:hypothetical protein [Saccharopolyspora sp. CA-218241]|uniref:hypothetical protein n=1 Tax=Saccharopolyspora sp. CA-218241 TaxID=3240027 RepID=UPI003D97CC75